MTAVIKIEFLRDDSAEADVHIEGVNEIQLFGAAKLIEQAGIEHIARRAMEGQLEQMRQNGGGIMPASAEMIRSLGKERT